MPNANIVIATYVLGYTPKGHVVVKESKVAGKRAGQIWTIYVGNSPVATTGMKTIEQATEWGKYQWW